MTESVILSETDIAQVIKIAEEGGKLAQSMRAGISIKEKTDKYDLVTDADYAVSDLLLVKLQEIFPDDLLISEEATPESMILAELPQPQQRVWIIDPIDGTDSYIQNDGNYAVMLGLLIDNKPAFGCVSAPARGYTYFGGKSMGVFRHAYHSGKVEKLDQAHQNFAPPVRLFVGSRDRRAHPQLNLLPDVQFVHCGCVGLRIAEIIEDHADIYIHLSKRLKFWDTVGPCAIAEAAGLEIGSLSENQITYDFPLLMHDTEVIIGRAGSLAWTRSLLSSLTN